MTATSGDGVHAGDARLSPYDVISHYDTGAAPSKARTAELFKELSAVLMRERDALQGKVAGLEAVNATQVNEITNLKHQMNAPRRSWGADALFTVIATVLVGWGVNLVATSVNSFVGISMIGVGALVHIANIWRAATQVSVRSD